MKPPRRVSPLPAVDELLERISGRWTPEPLSSPWLFPQEKPRLVPVAVAGQSEMHSNLPRLFYKTSSASGYSGCAVGVDQSQGAFAGFHPRKTAPCDLYQATVIAKPP
jgi:hypothetical protein